MTSYEILEPTLDLPEATQIFDIFKSKGQLHASIVSPEWAYEKIGKPHLLIEYVYLLTYGRMLEERLKDQVKQFSIQNEDPAKVEILRRTALAHALGTPVFANKLLENIKLRDDPQQVLKSLSGEYLILDDGVLTGLHWVRSNHLAHILHEGYPEIANTALAILEAIPPENISLVVFNAMCWLGLNVKIFINGLIEKAKNATLDTILAFLNGIFEAGERQFFKINQDLFDEAYGLIGQPGPSLLSTDFVPIGKTNTLNALANTFKDERGENYRKLQEIAFRFNKTARGLDICRDFLNNIAAFIQKEKLFSSFNNLGYLLNWCYLCKIQLPTWENIREIILTNSTLFEISLDEFCNFTQGLYQYDEPAYMKWFYQNSENIIGYLKLYLDCIELKISDNKLYIEFFPDAGDSNGVHFQALSRLKKLRFSIPFCERYQSQGIWLLPFGFIPSIDETKKDIKKENLPLELDIEKNIKWRKIVEKHYLPDSYYKYEEAWYALRCTALHFVQEFSKDLQRAFTGKKFNFPSLFEGGKLLVKLEQALKYVPHLSAENLEAIGKTLSQPLRTALNERSTNDWSSSFRNFFSQIFQYIQDRNTKTGRLAVHNFQNSAKYLRKMQFTFAQLFKDAPDYFSADELNTREIDSYSALADLLDVWIINPIKKPQRNIPQYIKTRKELIRQERLNRINKALLPLKENGMTIILPTDIYVDHPLRYFSIAFSVDNPCYPEVELEAVINAIVKDVADFFFLVPIYQNYRFFEGGYKISSNQIVEIKNGRLENWEIFVPRELPIGVLSQLPALPFRSSVRLQIRAGIPVLIAGIQMLVDLKNKIELLRISQNRFEVKLYDRHKTTIDEMEKNLSIFVSEFKDNLKSEFSARQDDSFHKKLQDFLTAVEEALRQGIVEKLLISDEFNAKDIVNSVEHLLK